MREITLSADDLIESLLEISKTETVCILDSCNISHLGSHLLIAGIKPLETLEFSNENANETLKILDEKITHSFAAIFTISYDFGLKIENIEPRPKEFGNFKEPDVFLALFDNLIIHDYDSHKTFLVGDEKNLNETEKTLRNSAKFSVFNLTESAKVESNFTRAEYLEAIEKVKEYIRRGDTYQTNLTQQLNAKLPKTATPQNIFYNLRTNYPAPFAAFIKRAEDFVISASPERFFKVAKGRNPRIGKYVVTSANQNAGTLADNRVSAFEISTSPIKGTRPRGKNAREDEDLRNELINSAKDRAENVMIVDLLRNDLGRICKFGSVRVEKLCDLEKHPTLFHLVSTINGKLRKNTKFSDIIRAVFPCGSITGAPKIRTMQIIDELETANRGLSMGAIGYSIQNGKRKTENTKNIFRFPFSDFHLIDLSVAIRTMVVKNGEAVFNVGGGIVIDSVPEREFEETLVKAKALLDSINAHPNFLNKTPE